MRVSINNRLLFYLILAFIAQMLVRHFHLDYSRLIWSRCLRRVELEDLLRWSFSRTWMIELLRLKLLNLQLVTYIWCFLNMPCRCRLLSFWLHFGWFVREDVWPGSTFAPLARTTWRLLSTVSLELLELLCLKVYLGWELRFFHALLRTHTKLRMKFVFMILVTLCSDHCWYIDRKLLMLTESYLCPLRYRGTYHYIWILRLWLLIFDTINIFSI